MWEITLSALWLLLSRQMRKMRKMVEYLFTVTVFSMVTMLVSAQNKVIKKLEDGENQRIVVYGTSLSASKEGWPAMLENSLNALLPGTVEVINSAQAAMWSTWGVENLREKVLKREPDMVMIEFAMNDAYLPYATSVEAARLNLEYMVCRIRELYPDCVIILQVMNMPVAEHKSQRPDIELYHKMYREESERLEVCLIDHYDYWVSLLKEGEEEFRKRVPDGIHPDIAAQKELVLPHILKALGVSNIKHRK